MAPVVRLYYAHFLRAPDHEGLQHWTAVSRSGRSLNAISEEFVRAPEFEARYGSLDDAAYVDLVYTNVLERLPDPEGGAYWRSQLAQGRSRGEVMAAFAESAEFRERMAGRVQATMLYTGMLRRAPEGQGLEYWAGVLDGGTPYRNVIAGFLGAPEYHDRIDEVYAQVEPLTGVPTREAPARPALAVKIDNVDAARPQSNIHRADLVYEELVEGNLTRLVAVFHADVPTEVGPVRSVRTTDIDILAQLNTPLLAASGANTGVLAAVAQADLVNVNALVAGGAYYRSSAKPAPHNLHARTADLYAAAGDRGGPPPVLFRYREPGTTPVGGQATGGVTVTFGSATVSYRWSSAEQGWRRVQNGSDHVTAQGVVVAPTNVVVLEVPYGTSAVDARSPEAHTVGSGPAHVFTGGLRVSGTWQRSRADERISITDGDGAEIRLDRGTTWVELAPQGSITLS